MTAKSELWRETLFFHENVILESGIQPLDAAGTALSQGMHSWASACIGSGGIPPEDGVSHTGLERELDHPRAVNPNTHGVIGGALCAPFFKKPPKQC